MKKIGLLAIVAASMGMLLSVSITTAQTADTESRIIMFGREDCGYCKKQVEFLKSVGLMKGMVTNAAKNGQSDAFEAYCMILGRILRRGSSKRSLADETDGDIVSQVVASKWTKPRIAGLLLLSLLMTHRLVLLPDLCAVFCFFLLRVSSSRLNQTANHIQQRVVVQIKFRTQLIVARQLAQIQRFRLLRYRHFHLRRRRSGTFRRHAGTARHEDKSLAATART